MTIVINDSFVMTLGPLIIFVLYDYISSYKFNHIFEDFYLCLKSKQMLMMCHFFMNQPKGDHM